jgi:hypothetical protein
VRQPLLSLLCQTAFITLLSGGCAVNRVDLRDAGQVRVHSLVVEGVTLPSPNVWADERDVTVYGSWHGKGPSSHVYRPGHVHLVLRTPEGKELDAREVRMSVTRTGGRTYRRDVLSYRSRYPAVPPPGSRLDVWHCHARHPADDANGNRPTTRS